MCYSNTYNPQIPTAQRRPLKDISKEAREAIFKVSVQREMLINSPHLSPKAKLWHKEIFWMCDNDGLHYCKKEMLMAIDSSQEKFWGIYEG